MSRITVLATMAVILASRASAQYMRLGCDPRGIKYPSCSVFDKSSVEGQRQAEAYLKKMAAARDQAARDLTAKIGRARQQFFGGAGGGAGRAQAEAEYHELLYKKDLWLLEIEVPTAFRGGFESYALEPSEVTVDGGLRVFAHDWFAAWVGCARTKTPPTTFANADMAMGVGQGKPLADVIDACRNTFEQYRLARDWGEFAGAGRIPTADPEEYMQLLFALWRPWARDDTTPPEPDFRERATRYRDDIATVFGRDALLAAARRLMSIPKDRDGRVAPPLRADGMELFHPWLVFRAMLGETSRRNAALMILVFQYSRVANVHAAEKEYQRLVAAYGEKAVQDEADAVRRAAKKSPAVLSDTRTAGVRRNYCREALEDLLEMHEPKGYARAILAYHDQLDSREAVDAAYDKLAAAYGESAIIEAAKRIAAGGWPAEYAEAARRHALGHDTPAEQYGILMAGLRGAAKLQPVAPRASSPEPSAMGDNPLYVVWAKFKPGAVATYAETTRVSQGGQLVPAPGSEVRIYSHKLQSIDSQGVTVEDAQATLTRSGRHGQEARPQSYAARLPKSALEGYAKAEYGADTLEVNGKTYQCRWMKVTGDNSGTPYTYTTWNSDAVPGGLVVSQLKSGGTITMKILQPFVVDNIYALDNYQKVYSAVRSVAANSPLIRP